MGNHTKLLLHPYFLSNSLFASESKKLNDNFKKSFLKLYNEKYIEWAYCRAISEDGAQKGPHQISQN